MERLTEWFGEHAAVVNHHVNYIDRLAAYEDTGATPDELMTYKKAKDGGRLVILPCKIGTEIFRIEDDYCDRRANDMCNEYCNGWDTTCEDYVGEKEVVRGHFCFSDIGNFRKTVFLTRNEADAKLKGES